MSARFVNIDRDTPLLLPPNLRDWVPDNHLAQFIIDAVAELELKFLKVGQVTVAVDGTKILANASKHSAVSFERAGEMIQQLELEVAQLLEKAEQADSTPLEEGLTIPEAPA